MRASICGLILITLVFVDSAAYGQVHDNSIGPLANGRVGDQQLTTDADGHENEALGLIFFNGFELGNCSAWSAVEPALIADFVFARGGLTVAAEDTSLNCPSFWEWDMGDGTTLFGSSAMHTYADPGTYQITLTVFNVSSTGSIDQSVTVD